ncbi:MAG: DUF4175 family protein [Proteobacteria bacterium]|nr:DUF4175 family protein [Pseudomonadota bacterium]
MSEAGPEDVERLRQRLAGRRARARAAILFERVWPAIWPALGVAGLFLILALLDVPRMLPAWAHIVLLAITAAGVLGLLARGLAGIARPDDAAADRRLEAASGLRHRPLSVLADRPAHDDPDGNALWAAHLRRAVAQVGALRVGRPSPGLARRDRRALRGGLVVALVAALVIAGPDAPARLAQAFQPALPGAGSAQATEVQAWITPPAYTRLPPMFLRPAGGPVTVPAGGHLTVSVTGGSAAPALLADGRSEPFRALDAASFQIDRDLTNGGRLTVRRDGSDLVSWDLTLIADRAPLVSWPEPPGKSPRSLQLRLPWEVSHEYGVVSLQAELRLAARPGAPPLVIAIPLPGGNPASARGVALQELTAHPWAGLPVTARLMARDAPGLTGFSAEAGFVLPERDFQNPVARALIAVRKELSVHPEDRAQAVARLDQIMGVPEALGGDYGAFLNLATTAFLLAFDRSEKAVAEAQAGLWQLALHMEEGLTDRTLRALETARDAAREALDRAMKEPTEENRAELERRLKELQDAIQQHMQALLDELKRSNDEMPFDPNAQRLDGQRMQRMADAAREAAREGRMNDAKREMAELDRLLEQLKNARVARGESDQRNAEKRARGRQEMGAVQDMIGRQGGLLDRAQQRGGPPPDPQRAIPMQPQTAAPSDQDRAGQEADRRVQQALRRALGELMQQFGDLAGEIPSSLSDADKAMRAAARALAEGKDSEASAAQQAAIAALQKGGREMGESMARQFGPPQPGEEGDTGEDGMGQNGMALGNDPGDGRGGLPRRGSADRHEGRDPLGRAYGNGSAGADEASDVTVPDKRERQRTEAIQEELRRRGAERDRPQQELDYIDRLLKQF